jgi:uncharacterized protein with ParB-like and HNH nuclease domain
MVYFCEGNDKEKLDWFKTINIAGEKLTASRIAKRNLYRNLANRSKKVFSVKQVAQLTTLV